MDSVQRLSGLTALNAVVTQQIGVSPGLIILGWFWPLKTDERPRL